MGIDFRRRLFRIHPEKEQGECIMAINQLGFRHLSTILDDGKGNLWIGAENDGLICYNIIKETIKTIQDSSYQRK